MHIFITLPFGYSPVEHCNLVKLKVLVNTFTIYLDIKYFSCFPICRSTLLIAAAASEHEASEQGSSLIGIRLHYRGLKSLFFLLNARNCGRW